MKIQSISMINSQTRTKNQNKTNDSQTFGCKYCRDMVDLFIKQRPDLAKPVVAEHVRIITSGRANKSDRFPLLHHGFLADRILLRLENSLEGVRKPAYFEHHVKAIVQRQNRNMPSLPISEQATESVPIVDKILNERGITNTKSLIKAIDEELSS